MSNDEAFRLMCENCISVDYDGSYVTAWKDDAEVTLECAVDDRSEATRQAIEMVVTRSIISHSDEAPDD